MGKVGEKNDTYIIVFESAKHFDLAKHSLGRDHRLKHVGHFFESDAASTPRISDRPDDAERPVAHHFVRLLGVDLRRRLLLLGLLQRLIRLIGLTHITARIVGLIVRLPVEFSLMYLAVLSDGRLWGRQRRR